MIIKFHDAYVLRVELKALYDISSQVHLVLYDDHLLFQALNPAKALAIDCEFPNNRYSVLCKLHHTKGSMDLTRLYTSIGTYTQKGDKLLIEISENKIVSVILDRLIETQNLNQTQKRKRQLKNEVLHIERTKTEKGEQQRLLICKTK